MLEKLEITVPLPPKGTHPNARPSMRGKMHAKKLQRQDAWLAAVAAMNELGVKPPRWTHATALATFHFPGNRAKPHDLDNLAAWAKATWDGLVTAGVLADDRGLVPLRPVQLIGKAATERKLVLIITPTQEQP